MPISPKPWFLFLVSVGLLAGCDDPTFLLPGSALSGDIHATPANWNFASDVGTVQLETNPAEPYSVNIEGVVIDERLYAYAGATRTTWAANMEANPDVRYRLNGDVYELRAVRIEDKAAIASFGETWTAKSRFMKDPTQFEEVWLFELVER